jgi:hypothetical protein
MRPTMTAWECPSSPDLNFSNRPVRTRTPGGVGGVRPEMAGPYPDHMTAVVKLTWLFGLFG